MKIGKKAATLTLTALLVLSVVFWMIAGRSYVSPFEEQEDIAYLFSGVVAFEKTHVGSYAWPEYFQLVRTPQGKLKGYKYSNDFLGEEVVLNVDYCMKHGILTSSWRFLSGVTKGDNVVGYWTTEQRIPPPARPLPAVAFLFKSGIVAVVADVRSLIEPSDALQKRPIYRVVRLFFVGEDYRKEFPQCHVVPTEIAAKYLRAGSDSSG